MGTNYYLELKEPAEACECCGHVKGKRHIGKSSAGWVFALRTYPEDGIHDLDDWMPLLQRGAIRDSTGRGVSVDELIRIITCRGDPGYPEERWEEKTWLPGNSEERFHAANGSARGPNGLLRSRSALRTAGTWECFPNDFS